MKFRALVTCSFASLLGVTVANAQTAEPESEAQLASSDQAAASGDIVVTARRREERLRDVPVAITAFSQDQLSSEGVRNVADLAKITPGFNATGSAGGGKARPIFELRGIYTGDVLTGQDQAVGLYLNEVYIARPIGTNQSLFDIENVQVLYGPQGTLFGRNTTAGALLLSTKRPTDRLEGEVWAGVGNYDWRQFGAVLNLPVSDAIQLRLAGQREKRDGYTINILNGQDLDDEDNYALRGTLRVAPAGGIESVTIADYFHSQTNQQGGQITQIAPPNGYFTLADGNVVLAGNTLAANFPGAPAFLATQLARGPYRVAYDSLQSAKSWTWGVGNTTTATLSDDLTLKNIIAYRKSYLSNLSDGDKTPFSALQGTPTLRAHQFSEELQLQGNSFDHKLTWILGGFYFREQGHETSFANNFAGTTGYTQTFNDFIGTNISKSLFAQGTYKITDGLNLTAGGRYTWDKRKIVYNNPRTLLRGNPPVAVVGIAGCSLAADLDPDRDCVAERSTTFSEPTYVVTLDYHPTHDTMVYVTHRRGYRSGGYNGRATNALAAAPFQPEISTDIEVGAKGAFNLGGDRRLTADFAFYRMKYDGLQRSIAVLNPTSNQVISVILNAASSTIKGFEAKVGMRIARGIDVSANWAHTNGVYDTFDGIRACPVFNTPCTAAQRIIVTGRDLPFGTVKDTVNGSLSVVAVDTARVGKITATASLSHRGSWFLQNDLPVLASKLPAYTIANLGLEWRDIAGSAVSGQIFVQNVFDKAYATSGLSLMTSNGFAQSYYGEPRMAGLSLRVAFDAK